MFPHDILWPSNKNTCQNKEGKKMKKTIATIAITAIVTAAIAAACFAGCAKKSVKQTVVAYLDQEGDTVTATVDLSDGYSCDIARGAVYLQDDKDNSVAMGLTLCQETYEDYAAAAKEDANSKELDGGVMFQRDGEMIFVKTVGDSAYFGVFAKDATPAQMEKLVERFTVAPEF
jgi:hypothetical protein